MEAVVERENMTAAYKRVVGNKGAAGTDGMTVDELKPYLDAHWERMPLSFRSIVTVSCEGAVLIRQWKRRAAM